MRHEATIGPRSRPNKLKKFLTEQMPDNAMLKDVASRKW